MPEDDPNVVLLAKVTVLEILVRALFRETFRSGSPGPVVAFDTWSQRFMQRLEAGALKDGTKEGEAAWIIASEQLNGFLDQLRHELILARDRGSQG